jgi:outer membrane protein
MTVQPTYVENVLQDGGASVVQARGVSINGTISAPLYAGGGIKNAVRAAENRVEAGFANLRGTESAIFSAVVGAYMDVIRDESIVDLNRAQVGVLSVNLDATRDRFEIGDLTRTDVAQSEARLALATSNMETARANLIRSKENYIQLVGREPGQLQAPPPLPNLPSTPDGAVTVALESNPDLIAARESRQAAGFDRRAANASRLPSISVFTSPAYSNALGSISSNIPGFRADNSALSAQAGVRATGQNQAIERFSRPPIGESIKVGMGHQQPQSLPHGVAVIPWSPDQLVQEGLALQDHVRPAVLPIGRFDSPVALGEIARGGRLSHQLHQRAVTTV